MRRTTALRIVRVQEAGSTSATDEVVFDYAIQQQVLLLTHDSNTIRGLYYARLLKGVAVPGLFLVENAKAIGKVIDSLELIVSGSRQDEWLGTIRYLPF